MDDRLKLLNRRLPAPPAKVVKTDRGWEVEHIDWPGLLCYVHRKDAELIAERLTSAVAFLEGPSAPIKTTGFIQWQAIVNEILIEGSLPLWAGRYGRLPAMGWDSRVVVINEEGKNVHRSGTECTVTWDRLIDG
jgi:hypothetical protein